MSSFRNTSEVKGWDQIMLFTETSEKTKVCVIIIALKPFNSI